MNFAKALCVLLVLPALNGCQSLDSLNQAGPVVTGDQVNELFVSLASKSAPSDCIPIITKHLREIEGRITLKSGQVFFASGTSINQELQQFILGATGRSAYIKNLNGSIPEIRISASQFNGIWRQFDSSASFVTDWHSSGHANCLIAVRNSSGKLTLFSSPGESTTPETSGSPAMIIGDLMNSAAGAEF